jgi:hypothetical protein
MPGLIALIVVVLGLSFLRTTGLLEGPVQALARALRLLGVALGAGVVAGTAGGLGARLVMRIVAIMGRSHYGEVTHHNAVTGVTTLGGTMNLAIEGALLGVAGSLFYLVVRPWLPGRPLVRGLLFGLLLLLAVGTLVLDGDYEYYRYVSPAVSVSLFALLFPLYGAVLAWLIERWDRDRPQFTGWPLRIGRGLLGVLAITTGLNLLDQLRIEYQLFT